MSSFERVRGRICNISPLREIGRTRPGQRRQSVDPFHSVPDHEVTATERSNAVPRDVPAGSERGERHFDKPRDTVLIANRKCAWVQARIPPDAVVGRLRVSHEHEPA